MTPTIRVKLWGDYACFTRPEFKAERVSYEVMTPSAARGAIEAILWRPAIFWIVRRIEVLRPIRFIGFHRNEVTDRAPAEHLAAQAAAGRMTAFLADERRAQRHTLALRDVAYVVEVSPQLTPRAGPGETIAKFVDMLTRRVRRGQSYHQPSFGLREFAANFGPDDGEPPIGDTRDIGQMLHDIEYGNPNRPHFFAARLENGILRVPTPSWLAKTA
ncbi:MAG: type I-C CRISPR-associated protein Cas5c [Candidatus Velthaea sp.]